MSGTITRKTILCHPLLVAELFGWRVVVMGLVSRKPHTFLDLLRVMGDV